MAACAIVRCARASYCIHTQSMSNHASHAFSTCARARAPRQTSQGELFQRWVAIADEYACDATNNTRDATGQPLCDPAILSLRGSTCAAVAKEQARPPARADQFSVVVSYAPKRNRRRILKRIERQLQELPELHSIFLIVHGKIRVSKRRPFIASGRKPVVEVHPPYDALGNRFGPLRLPTSAVLVMDDDVLLDGRDVQHAFAAWQQSPTRIVGTWHRTLVGTPRPRGPSKASSMDANASSMQGASSSELTYRDNTADREGIRRNNVILTKFMFVHRDYLFMYSCLLPFLLWHIPNRLTNCEDVLMNLLVRFASQLAPLPYQPVYSAQLDYGTPAPANLRNQVVQLAGLSGGGNHKGGGWHDTRSICTNEVATHFGGLAGEALVDTGAAAAALARARAWRTTHSHALGCTL